MNFGTPVPLLLGIFMVISSVALFFLDRLKPGYERDSDKVYAILFLLSGVFLLANLGMDVISSFQQMLLAGIVVSLMIQNVNAREPLAKASFQVDGDFDGGGYRPPARGGRPRAYPSDNRPIRAELDRRDYGPADPYNRPRPMLEGRGEPSRPPYNADVYGDGRPMRRDDAPRDRPLDRPNDRPTDRPMDRPLDRPMGDRPQDGPYGPDTYGAPSRPGDDRLRRRRPPKNRGEYNDRYRNDPGMPPYRPDRDQL